MGTTESASPKYLDIFWPISCQARSLPLPGFSLGIRFFNAPILENAWWKASLGSRHGHQSKLNDCVPVFQVDRGEV
jgi:hypothetical protein